MHHSHERCNKKVYLITKIYYDTDDFHKPLFGYGNIKTNIYFQLLKPYF